MNKRNASKKSSILGLVLMLSAVGPVLAQNNTSSFPYPITMTFNGDGTLSAGYTSQSSKSWRELYCKDGFNNHCFNHMVFKMAAQQQMARGQDLGLKIALGAVNKAIADRLGKSQKELSAAEKDHIAAALNYIRSEYEKAKKQATGSNLLWTEEESVKSIYNIANSIPGVGIGATITKELVYHLESMIVPMRQLMAQNKYYAASLLSDNMGDVFGDLHLNSKIMKGLSGAVDPFLVTWIGIKTTDDTEKLIENDHSLGGLIASRANRELLLKIFESIKDGHELTEAGFRAILEKFETQQSQSSKEIVQPSGPSEAELAYEAKVQKLVDYENSIRLFNTFTNLLPEGKFKEVATKSAAIANVATSVYRAVLDPQKLGKLVMTANVVEAASMALRLFFNSGPDANTLILDSINQLRTDINVLHQNMAIGFSDTHRKLDVIFEQIGRGFDSVLKNQDIEMDLLRNMQRDLYYLRQDLSRLDVSMREYFDSISKRFSDLITSKCLDRSAYYRSNGLTEREFAECKSQLQKMGAEHSRDALEAQMAESDFNALRIDPEGLKNGAYKSSRPYALEAVASELNGRDPLSQLNYFGALMLLHPKVDSFPYLQQQLMPVASLHKWLIGANTFLEFLNNNLKHKKWIEKEDFSSLQKRGVEIQEFITKLRSESAKVSILSLLKEKQKSFMAALKALQTGYVNLGNISAFDNRFWGTFPTSGALTPESPVKEISAEALGGSKSYPIDFDMSRMPELAKLALQLGVGKLSYKTVAVSDAPHKWNNLYFIKTERYSKNTIRGCGGDPYCGETRWIEKGKIEANLKIQTQFMINETVVLNCYLINHARLLIGNYQHEGKEGAGPDKRKDDMRSLADVVDQIWEDGNYNLKKRLRCQAPIKSFRFGEGPKFDDLSGSPLKALVEQEWAKRQKDFLAQLSLLLKQNKTGESFDLALKNEMENVLKASRELSAVYELIRYQISIAFVPQAKEKSELREAFFSGSTTLSPLQFAEYLGKEQNIGARPIAALEELFVSKNALLEEKMRDQMNKLQGSSGTLPELDAMMELIAFMRAQYKD